MDPSAPPLDHSEVHLWIQPLDLPLHAVLRFGAILSEEERVRSERFRFERDRRRFIVARGRLRELLSRYLACEPAQIVFAYNAFGKPSLAAPAATLQFNLSHSDDLAAHAFTNGREVGVDIEAIRSAVADELIPERFFSPDEVARLRALPESLQDRAFFECWTRKEAYVKALGKGLTIPLNSFDVSLGQPAIFLRNAEGWSMRSFDAGMNYVGAVVAPGRDWTLRRMEAS